MSCEWGRDDCQNINLKCHLCITDAYHYIEPKKRPKKMSHKAPKADGRMGSSTEFRNHVANRDLLSETTTRMTPNSGAGRIKGDQEIAGLVHIMEEIKTKVKEQAPGKQSFTIQRSWLDKLNQEAKQANKEFWYLKYSFNEFDEDVYIIVEQDIIMSMVFTLVSDRKAAISAQKEIAIANKRKEVVEAENILLKAKLELLQLELERKPL
jgi:hypothetical protein